MQQYLVKISFEAKDQIRNILEYLFFVFKSKQAYDAVKKDFFETVDRLSYTAGVIPESDNEKLRKRRLKIIHFKSHGYIMLFRVDANIATIVEVHHETENYT